jgi:hypothetical protein
MSADALAVVRRWHHALNAGVVEQMVALVHPYVEIGGPRGSVRGAEVVAEWFGRANVRLLPQRWFRVHNQIVVEELAEWLSPQGEVISSQVVATAFDVDAGGLITRIVRHDALAAALEDRCLSLEDEIESEIDGENELE